MAKKHWMKVGSATHYQPHKYPCLTSQWQKHQKHSTHRGVTIFVCHLSVYSIVYILNGAATKQWILQQLQSKNGACTHRCIFKQMHYETPFLHNGYMKSLEFYENYITLFWLEKRQTFWQYYINSKPCMAYYPKWLKEIFTIATIKEQHHSVTCSVSECTVMWCSALWCRRCRIHRYVELYTSFDWLT